jgi:hypothetical protein
MKVIIREKTTATGAAVKEIYGQKNPDARYGATILVVPTDDGTAVRSIAAWPERSGHAAAVVVFDAPDVPTHTSYTGADGRTWQSEKARFFTGSIPEVNAAYRAALSGKPADLAALATWSGWPPAVAEAFAHVVSDN